MARNAAVVLVSIGGAFLAGLPASKPPEGCVEIKSASFDSLGSAYIGHQGSLKERRPRLVSRIPFVAGLQRVSFVDGGDAWFHNNDFRTCDKTAAKSFAKLLDSASALPDWLAVPLNLGLLGLALAWGKARGAINTQSDVTVSKDVQPQHTQFMQAGDCSARSTGSTCSTRSTRSLGGDLRRLQLQQEQEEQFVDPLSHHMIVLTAHLKGMRETCRSEVEKYKMRHFLWSLMPCTILSAGITVVSSSAAARSFENKDNLVIALTTLNGFISAFGGYWNWQSKADKFANTAKQSDIMLSKLKLLRLDFETDDGLPGKEILSSLKAISAEFDSMNVDAPLLGQAAVTSMHVTKDLVMNQELAQYSKFMQDKKLRQTSKFEY